jgi:thiamine kinase-like enzyme
MVDPDNETSIKNAAVELVHYMNDTSDLSIEKVSGGNTNVIYCVKKISGGITNQLYKVDLLPPVLVRIFGAAGLIDRDIENTNYSALAAKGLAPPYYGRFANGRIEGWLEMRPLEVTELGLFNKQIAQQLGKMHAKFIPEKKESPNMWSQLRSWMDQALEAEFQGPKDEERAAELDLSALPAELDRLHDSLVPKDARTAFCHNDVLAANVLVSFDLKEIRLIDYEYGGFNYVAFDIANHFNEYAGGTDDGVPNYDWFPSEEKQREFVKEYLRASQGRHPSQEEIDGLHAQVKAFVLVNHLYWGLWAVNQASTEGCNSFDYLLYAKHRISRYRETKINGN